MTTAMLRICLFATALTLSACASAPRSESSARDCFRTFDVRGYGIVDDHRVRLRINSTRAYIVTIPQNTRDFDVMQPITVRSASGFVCVGDPAGVQLVTGDLFPSQVTNIERAPTDVADQAN